MYVTGKLIPTVQRVFYKHKDHIDLESISTIKIIFKEDIRFL